MDNIVTIIVVVVLALAILVLVAKLFRAFLKIAIIAVILLVIGFFVMGWDDITDANQKQQEEPTEEQPNEQ